MIEYRSIHCDTSVAGSLAGAEGRLGLGETSMPAVTSDICRNSRFNIFFTILCGSDAIVLKGPGEWSLFPPLVPSFPGGGVPFFPFSCCATSVVGASAAAEARMFSLLALAWLGLEVGMETKPDSRGSKPRGARPTRYKDGDLIC